MEVTATDAQRENAMQPLDNKGFVDSDQVKIYSDASRLRFSGQLEQAFQTAYSRNFNTYIRYVMLFATVIYIASGIYDYVMLTPLHSTVWQVRYLLGAPPLLLLGVYTFSNNFWRFQQPVLLSFVLVITITLMLMNAITLHEYSHVYFTGALISMMAGFNIMRLQFRFAVVAFISMVMFEILVLCMFHHPWQRILTDVYFFFSVSVISLTGNYFIERFARRDYLQKRLLRREQEQLQQMNDHLQYLVTSDSLTKIANRRSFDETIEDEWRRAQRGCYPLSLMMIDIDHFKAFNDHYGHQRGDECLRQVAKVLSSFGKRAGDLVARYGGEEFAVISAGTAYKDAITLGQKICKAVQQARFPHDASKFGQVTVSVGVATVTPLVEQPVNDLIQQADKSLYQAKANGRNCVFGEKAMVTRLESS